MPKKRHLIQTITAFLLTIQIATAIDDSARLVVRPDSSTVEFGSKVAFFCRADGNPLPPIQWNINGKTADTENQRLTIISKSYGISTLRLDPVQLEDNGTVVSCHADNSVGHPVFAEATLLVLKNDTLSEGFPQIVVHPALRTIENGKTAYVSCRVSGDPRPKVLWLRDSIPLDMRADSRYSVSTIGNPGALMIQHAREEDQGIYECIARNVHGVAHSKQANLYVKVRRVPPYFSYKLEKLYRVAQGGSINLTCVAVGYPMPRVFWRKHGQTVNLDDSISAPIGKNLLTLTHVERSDNFTCVAVSPLGNIEATTQILVLPLPTPPKDVKITGITSTGLTVIWKSPKFDQPILNYVVKYRQRGNSDASVSDSPDAVARCDFGVGKACLKYGESKKWIEVKSPDTKLSIDGLEPFQQYEFTVAAEVEVGVGEASMVIEAQTDEQKPQSPPTKPQARSLSRDSLLVKWSPSERPNGVVTSYNVYYTNGSRDLPIEEWNTLTTKADELLATISELEIDTKYYIRVQAVNSKGTSPLSQVVTVQTIHGLPGQPPGLNAKALDAKRIALTWEKPLFSVPISGYVISYNTTDDVREITLTSPHEKHTVTALNPDTPYSFRIAAYTSRGQGEFTELVHEKTPSPTPYILPKFESTSKSLHIFWNMSSEFNVVMYRVKYCEKLVRSKKNDDVGSSEEQERRQNTKDSEPSRPWATIETEDTHANLTYLMPYTMYEVVVAAKIDDSWAEYSQPREFRTNEDVPSAPRHLDVTLTSPTSVKITWQPPVHANGILMGYYIYHDKMSGDQDAGSAGYNKRSTTQIRDPAKTYFEMDKLEPNTEYAFRMNAFNRNGDGEFTEVRTIVTGGIAPNPPEILSLSLVRDDAPLVARIDWKPPAIRPNEGPINKYNIWYKPKGFSNSYLKMKSVEGTATSTEIQELWMGLEYDIWLGAENEEGQSGNATETLLTPMGSPDGEPQGVQYEISQGKIVVSWMPPPEDKRNGNITAYKAILTPMDSVGERIERKIDATDSTSPQRVAFSVDAKKAYTFKIAASTMKGYGPYSPVLTINPDASALVGPPSNVRVQATSDTSAVVQWDFDNGQADAFVIKYLHEPGGKSDTDRWSQHSVVGHVRHFEVPNLVSGKPYAFCVLTVKNNRQGPCSDPPTILEQVKPTFMVQKLRVAWKTSNSVMLQWEYDGPKNINFYLNHTGKKEYLDQTMQLKQMKTPGFEHELDSGSRQYLWTTLRPHMQYTFHVGVRSTPPGARQYWPMEVTTITDPTGPPFVDIPILMDSSSLKVGQIQVRLSLASEEYGPISHYWLIVVPGNYSNDDVVNLESSELEKSTAERSRFIANQKQSRSRRSILPNYHNGTNPSELEPRHRRTPKKHSGAFVTAQISTTKMQDDYKNHQSFVIGDDRVYDGFTNYALEPNTRYKLMMRAFAKSEGRRKELDSRAPMSEKLSKLYTDSALSGPFTTKSGTKGMAGGAGKYNIAYLIGPAIAILVIAFTIGMVLCWFLRCRNRRTNRGARHGSIAKVALSNNMMTTSNGVYGETSKLLNGDDGRHVMNPYEQMNGGGATDSSFALYPLPTQALNHRSASSTYAPLPVPVPSLPHHNNNTTASPLSHAAIPISELQHHIDRLRMNNNLGFQQEFESIETGQHFSWENSSADVNKHKNRYANVVAYDHTRVILSDVDGIPGSDYINANYVDGYDKPKAYIATQGPLAETFADFWRMIWEEGSATIVMLTNLEERARIKCDQYWPTRGTSTYGDIQVTLLETATLAHYTMRIFRLQMIGESEAREIRHLQYTAWPDHGVPDHPTPFLIFLKRVKSLNPPGAGPIVSHCSAGIGRTGAFIVIDIILERLRYENTVDIYGCVTSLRSQRSYMVQTEEQYIFIHDAILDAVQSGSTEIPVAKLKQHVAILQQRTSAMDASTIELEFRHLGTLKWPNNRRAIGNLPLNRGKNRPNGVVPFDANRVVLSQILGVDGSDYINASWMDGYRERGAYIATQGPTMDTYNDFWRMVWENDSAIIVMLVKTWENGREQCIEYWPRESHGVQVGNLVLQLMNEYNMPQYVLREFKLADVDSNMSRTIRHFQYMDWPEVGVPSNAEAYIDFIQQVHRTKSQFGVDGPIAVHCSEGAGRTGIFIALSTLIERIRAEKVVDVFTTVKLLRTERECVVSTKEEYNFLYEACIEYLNCL